MLNSPETLLEIHDRYLRELLSVRQLSPMTFRGYEAIFRRFLCFLLENDRLCSTPSDITSDAIRDYLVYLSAVRQLKPVSLRDVRNTLKAFWEWLRKHDHSVSDIFTKVPSPRLGVRLPRSVDRHDAQKIIQTAYLIGVDQAERCRNRLILALMLFAGLRRGEVIGLSVRDVNLGENIVNVRRGKGAKDRIVPMSPRLRYYLQEYLRSMPSLSPEGWLLPGAELRRSLSESKIASLVARVRAMSGVRFSAHSLRHSFATFMLEGGANLYVVSRLMGHTNVNTTSAYLSANTSHLSAVISHHPMG